MPRTIADSNCLCQLPEVIIGAHILLPMKDVRLAFAERLIEICTEKGLKAHGRQAALARQLKVTQPAVKKWFDADAIPDTDKIIELALWCGVCFEWLMTGRGPKRIEELYPTKAIAHVAQVMQAMEPEQQYLAARLVDQVKKPDDAAVDGKNDPNSATGTG